ncbi:hypothetical protein [Flavitalea sp.]|nr:hypothetical protein [Flavitalea sp.]
MRKIILQEWFSLDGFAADEKGSTDFFTAPEFKSFDITKITCGSGT